jgi:hypothetical protein
MTTEFIENKILIQRIKNLSDDTIGKFISDAYAVGDDNLENAYKKVVQTRSDFGSEFSGLLSESIDDLVYFMEDSDNRFVSRWAKRRIRKVEAVELKKDIFKKFGNDLNGLELSNADGNGHALITPDASKAGGFRATYFDNKGFSSHDTYDGYEDVLISVIAQKYKTMNPGILDKLSQTAEFIEGNRALGEIQKSLTQKPKIKIR